MERDTAAVRGSVEPGVSLMITMFALLAATLCQDPLAQSEAELVFRWDARAAEHLINRAGFGARPDEIERAVQVGQTAAVAQLLAGERPEYEPYYPTVERPGKDALAMGDKDAMLKRFKASDRNEMGMFGAWWTEEMVRSGHPLRERMTLFWHGHFTSSYRTVKSSGAMIRQNELFRSAGLGSFRGLLLGVLEDPAMLIYLDGTKNKKDSPNENLARELMELFTLGEGNYTEQDVKEAARALTGWRVRNGEARFNKRRHDAGQKTILGRTSEFGAHELVDHLLAQPACSRWIAGRLLAYFEGVAPTEERLQHYAELLVDADWQIADLLAALFADQEFYSPATVGQRVASPVDFLVGLVRRLDSRVPPVLVAHAAALLGERLFHPPSVKGWEGGLGWITTSTIQQRGNLAGMLLGVVDIEDVLTAADLVDEDAMFDPDMMSETEEVVDDSMKRRTGAGSALRKLRKLRDAGWRPHVNLSARTRRANARTDNRIADVLIDELLAVPVSKASRRAVIDFIASEREALGIDNKRLMRRGLEAERCLRRTAHVILSLPEAHLN